MTNEQILKKAIEKAINNGLDIILPMTNDFNDIITREVYQKMKESKKMLYVENLISWDEDYLKFIFSHDFAKAFWGDDDLIRGNNWGLPKKKRFKKWQYHLQQLVILLENERIKYLEKFL